MGSELEKTHEIVRAGIGLAFDSFTRDLKRLVRHLKSDLSSLNAESLPEYQKVIRAIRDYKEAVIRNADALYKHEE